MVSVLHFLGCILPEGMFFSWGSLSMRASQHLRCCISQQAALQKPQRLSFPSCASHDQAALLLNQAAHAQDCQIKRTVLLSFLCLLVPTCFFVQGLPILAVCC